MQLVGLFLALVTSTMAEASAPHAVLNGSTQSIAVPSNSSHASQVEASSCLVPFGSAENWWYNTRSNGPYECYGPPNAAWAMLKAYRSGGTENVHWKYTDDIFDPECFNGWKYYAEDGKRFIGVFSRLTKTNSDRNWCAMPVYRSGGVESSQWEWCSCR
jgi:hypothetical protein